MAMLLLSIANLATIVLAAVIGVRVLRGNRFTLSGLAVGTVLVSTAMWAVISLVGAQGPFKEGSYLPARALFWSAVLIAGIRSLVRVLENPAWSPQPRDIINLIAHPAAMGVIAALPSLHHLVVTADADGNLSYAFGFWIHTVVGLALSVRPLTLLLKPRGRVPRDSVRMRLVMIVSWALPAAGYAISALVWGPTGPNLATAFLIVPVAMLGSAVVRDGLVDRLPLARGEVFEALAGAVFVTDRLGRVIDVNAAARALARDIDGVEDISGRILEEVCPETARILDRGGEADVPGTGGDRVVSMLSTPIVDGRGETVGRCVIVRDVTESVIQRRELERTRDALSYEVTVSEELRAELGNQVMRDSATGLYNRRYLAHILPEIVASSVADGSALSVAVFDIDDFKIVNDSHGHVAGDRVIEAVATALRVNAPGGTVVRYGGDEFLALLPGLTAREALAVTNSMRAACAVVRVDTRDGEVGVTVSAGVATLIGEEVNADELLEVADLALYRAKNTGRDRTWSPVEDPA
jgi:diguanylate cyclase (GGDEF)-like protein